MLTSRPDRRNRPQPSLWWWVAFACILAFSGSVRYVGYNYGLPYVESLDEPALTTAADSILQVGTALPIHHFDAYPPGIITLEYFLLRWFHNPAESPTTILPIVRLMSITTTMGIAVMLALLAYRVAGPLAGLLAAGLWGVSTSMVEHSRYATADNFQVFFLIMALLLTLQGVTRARARLLTFGVLSLSAAIAFKYQAVFWLPLIFLIPLRWLRVAKPENRWAILLHYVDNAVITGAFLFWLIALTPALNFSQVSDAASAYTGNFAAPTPSVLLGVIGVAMGGYAPLVSVPGLLGLGLYSLKPLQPYISRFDLGVVLTGMMFWIVGMSFFGVQDIRHSIVVVALLAVLVAAGFAGWAVSLKWLLERLNLAGLLSRHKGVSQAIIAGLVLAANLRQIAGSIENAREHTLPERRNDLAAWFDSTLDPALYIADRSNHKTFDRYWGGYSGQGYFPLFAMELLTQRPLEEWRDNDVLYAIVPYDAYQQMQTTAEGLGYLDQMVLLKSYPPDPRYRGPSMVVFRLYPMQHQATGDLGPIKLLGYDIDRTEVAPGESFTIRYYWRASQPTDVPYVVFNHLDPLDSVELVAQSDGPPLSLNRPTTSWNDPNETILSQPFTIVVGEDAPPGEYRLVTGFYRLDNGQRLTSPMGETFVPIVTIRVR